MWPRIEPAPGEDQLTPDRVASVLEARIALAEERARTAERRLWDMSGEIQEVYLEFCRRDLRLVYVSRSFEALFERSLAEACSDTEAFLAAFGDRQREQVLQTLRSPEEVSWQRFLIATPDEAVRAVRMRMTPSPTDQSLSRGVIVRVPRGSTLLQPGGGESVESMLEAARGERAQLHDGPGAERRLAS